MSEQLFNRNVCKQFGSNFFRFSFRSLSENSLFNEPLELPNMKRHSEGTFSNDYSKYLETRRAQDFVQWLKNSKRNGWVPPSTYINISYITTYGSLESDVIFWRFFFLYFFDKFSLSILVLYVGVWLWVNFTNLKSRQEIALVLLFFNYNNYLTCADCFLLTVSSLSSLPKSPDSDPWFSGGSRTSVIL